MTTAPGRATAVLWGVLLGVCAGCTSDTVAHPRDQTVLIQEAIARGEAAAVVAVYVEDAQVIPPDTAEPVQGRAAIQALWQGRLDEGLRAIEYSQSELRGEGEMRFETGTYTSRNAAGEIDVGKYFTVWQRVGDTWRVSRHTWASDLEDPADVESAPADPAAAPPHPEPDAAVE